MSKSFITDRKIRLGLVGCGRIAIKHFEAIIACGQDLELVAVCDINPDVLKQLSLPDVAKYESIDALIAREDLDIVVICTPSGLHAQHVIKAAQAKKHVITEKPMATKWEDGLAMVRVCEEESVQLFVVKQNRHNSTLQLVKKAIEQQRFGKIYLVGLNVFWTRPQAYYDQAPWRGTWEYDGGALMNQASHYLDLMHWLIGPVMSVQAMTATLARRIETEDTAVLNVKWRHGALGSAAITMLTYPNNLEGSLTILGEKGTVKVGGVAVNQIQHWAFAHSQPEDELIAQANYDTTSVYGFGHTAYYRNIIDVCRGNAKPLTDGREGLHSLELLIAAYRSARDNQIISLPLAL